MHTAQPGKCFRAHISQQLFFSFFPFSLFLFLSSAHSSSLLLPLCLFSPRQRGGSATSQLPVALLIPALPLPRSSVHPPLFSHSPSLTFSFFLSHSPPPSLPFLHPPTQPHRANVSYIAAFSFAFPLPSLLCHAHIQYANFCFSSLFIAQLSSLSRPLFLPLFVSPSFSPSHSPSPPFMPSQDRTRGCFLIGGRQLSAFLAAVCGWRPPLPLSSRARLCALHLSSSSFVSVRSPPFQCCCIRLHPSRVDLIEQRRASKAARSRVSPTSAERCDVRILAVAPLIALARPWHWQRLALTEPFAQTNSSSTL